MSDLSIERGGDSSSARFSANDDLPEIGQSTNKTKSRRNFPLAVLGGFIGSLAAVFLWGLAAYLTGSQLLLLPIGVGLIVGLAVRLTGRGRTLPFGLLGAVFSLLGCFLGHFVVLAAIAAAARNVSPLTVAFAFINTELDEEFLVDSFGTFELAFYAVAFFVGYIVSVYKNNGEKNLQKA